MVVGENGREKCLTICLLGIALIGHDQNLGLRLEKNEMSMKINMTCDVRHILPYMQQVLPAHTRLSSLPSTVAVQPAVVVHCHQYLWSQNYAFQDWNSVILSVKCYQP